MGSFLVWGPPKHGVLCNYTSSPLKLALTVLFPKHQRVLEREPALKENLSISLRNERVNMRITNPLGSHKCHCNVLTASNESRDH